MEPAFTARATQPPHVAATIAELVQMRDSLSATIDNLSKIYAPPITSTPLPVSIASAAKKRNQAAAKKEPAANLPGVAACVLDAITEGPKSGEHLLIRVRQLRPGTPFKHIHKACSALKLRGRIEKIADLWQLTKAMPAPAPPQNDGPSNRDIVRQVLNQRVDRTKFEIADHAIRLRSSLKRGDVLTILSQLKAEGEVVDKDDLFVVAGPRLKVPAGVQEAH